MATDPLSGLNTPSVTKFPEIKNVVISDFSEQIAEMREAIDAVAVAADEAIEAMPKVVQCYECENFAFEGTTTLMEVREEDDDRGLGGAKPFCPDCVSAIEKRSKKPTAPTLSWGTGSNWYTTTPYSFTVNFDSSKTYDEILCSSGDALYSTTDGGATWTAAGDLAN